ncbi:hypothetical protein F4779DRAFT_571156 [Xylariaceae sp. FL0662B]|nr:hypothetical protein F4779DRAFT_571156 [Xylariaceae sp. FL0662B]
MVDVHRGYDRWNDDKSRWSTDILAGKYVADRLPSYPGQLPRPLRDRSQYRRKRIEDLPRPEDRDTPFGEINLSGEVAESSLYSVSENNYFRDVLDPRPEDDPRGTMTEYSRYRADVSQYEECMEGGIQQTIKLMPPDLTQDDRSDKDDVVMGDNIETDKKDSDDTVRGEKNHSRRGWERAALQQCLNVFTNHENRVINTPWRRAVLPYKEPVPMPKEIVYQARVLSPERVPESLKDPFPWFHWYSQYSQLINYIAGWQRRRYNVENWTEGQRSALPMNFQGPYTYLGLSIYDDYWIKVGQYLEDLAELLDDRYGVAPRPLLMAILRDIDAGRQEEMGEGWSQAIEQAGLGSRKGQESWKKKFLRRDIMRRSDIDHLEGNEDEYLLMDEIDAAWMRFLCQPSRTHQMCDPKKQLVNNIDILFNSRLQSYLNNTMVSGTVGAGRGSDLWEDWDEQEWERTRNDLLPYLSQVLTYTNGGEYSEDKDTNGNAFVHHPNKSYQFSTNEAKHLCIALHGLGRCEYLATSNPEEDPKIARPKYNIHPEHRIRWRHQSAQAFEAEKLNYSGRVLEHLDEKYPSITQSEVFNVSDTNVYDEYAYILDHVGDKTLAAQFGELDVMGDDSVIKGPAWNKKKLIESTVAPEYDWVKGEYEVGSVEEKRQAPSWEDLADWEELSRCHTKAGGNLRTPDKTSQFLRTLAFRMGRTIRHANQIKDKLQYWLGNTDAIAAGEKEGFNMGKAISLDGFHQELDHWEQSIRYGVGEVEFMPPTIQSVVDKADPLFTIRNALQDKNPYTIIREGIISDCVENRNTLYPGRLEGFEDSSYFVDPKQWNEKRSKLFVGYQRPNLFSWATKAQRQYQAKYTRRTYFSMMRWPLRHQTTVAREGIKRRMEEVIKIDPREPKQKYGILTHRVPLAQEKPTYIVSSGICGNVTSAASVPRSFGMETETLMHSLGSSLGTAPVPSTQVSLRGGANISSRTAEPSHHPNEQGNRKIPRRNLVPITRQRERFIPGPVIFPMGESLLQQVAISQQIESALYPPVKLPWYKWMFKKFKEYTDSVPPQIPLLPPTDPAKIPRSNPNKRKVPADFLTDTVKRPTKRPITSKTRTSQEPARVIETSTPTKQPVRVTEPGTSKQPVEVTETSTSKQPVGATKTGTIAGKSTLTGKSATVKTGTDGGVKKPKPWKPAPWNPIREQWEIDHGSDDSEGEQQPYFPESAWNNMFQRSGVPVTPKSPVPLPPTPPESLYFMDLASKNVPDPYADNNSSGYSPSSSAKSAKSTGGDQGGAKAGNGKKPSGASVTFNLPAPNTGADVGAAENNGQGQTQPSAEEKARLSKLQAFPRGFEPVRRIGQDARLTGLNSVLLAAIESISMQHLDVPVPNRNDLLQINFRENSAAAISMAISPERIAELGERALEFWAKDEEITMQLGVFVPRTNNAYIVAPHFHNQSTPNVRVVWVAQYEGKDFRGKPASVFRGMQARR